MGNRAVREYHATAMQHSPTRTGDINHTTAVYSSMCHQGERTILEGQPFPRCAHCNADTVWIFIQPAKPPNAQIASTGR